MKNILLTDGEFTGMIKTLRSLKEEVRIVGFVSSPLAAHITMLDRYYVAPDWRSADYLEFLLNIIVREKIDYVFPVITTSLEYMASMKEVIYEKTGAIVIVSDAESIHIANDKSLLFEAVRNSQARDAVTEFFTVSTVGKLISAVRFFEDKGISAVSKPVIGENAEGFMHFVQAETFAEELLKGTGHTLVSTETFKCLENDFRLPEKRLVMPFLPGKEWDVDVLIVNGRIAAATTRVNNDMVGGLSACSTTCDNPELIEICQKIIDALGLSFLACLSFKEDKEGTQRLLEINPRSMGSIHLSTMCGNNLLQQLFDSIEVENTSYEACVEEKPVRLTPAGFTASLYYDLVEVRPQPVIWNRIAPPHYELYEKYYNKISSRITDIVFNCRFAWDSMYHFKWAVMEGCFVQISFGSEHSGPFMLMPLGEFDSAKLDRIIGIVRKEFDIRGLGLTIYGIDEKYLEIFENIKTSHGKIYYDDDFSDYLYDAESLRTLAGRKYSKKRNHLHNFLKKYPDFRYESLGRGHFEECLGLVKQWTEDKGVDYLDVENSDYPMIENMLSNWDRLGCRGGVIIIDGKIAAFSIGSLEGDTAYIHFEKADTSYDGLYVAINQLVLVNEFPKARYVNREEDLGIEGLRRAKQSYFPIEMVKKYKMDIS